MAVKRISKKTKQDIKEKNTTIVKNKGRQDEEIIKEGVESPIKATHKNTSLNTVGLSIGVTLNLGDFQSLRIDCWGQQEVESPDDREETLLELTEVLQEHITYVADVMQDEE